MVSCAEPVTSSRAPGGDNRTEPVNDRTAVQSDHWKTRVYRILKGTKEFRLQCSEKQLWSADIFKAAWNNFSAPDVSSFHVSTLVFKHIKSFSQYINLSCLL